MVGMEEILKWYSCSISRPLLDSRYNTLWSLLSTKTYSGRETNGSCHALLLMYIAVLNEGKIM